MMIAHHIIKQLVHSGVRHFCIAPGSRSTPLVCAAAEHPLVKTHVHFDERGLGFYALGLAKALQKPVAVIVTSGTALGNLLPAVMEAYHTRVPLILLTADRPPELQKIGANQACEQRGIFGKYVVEEFQLASDQTLDFSYYGSLLAFASAISQKGPVHINCPFREPFTLTNGLPDTFSPHTGYTFETPKASEETVTYFAKKCAQYKKGVILLGRGSCPIDATVLANRLQWPIFADILSESRTYTPSDPFVPHFDYLIEREDFIPEAIIHFGGSFVSKKLFTKLGEKKPAFYLHVEEKQERQDPAYIVTHKVACHPRDFCKQLTEKSRVCDLGWLPAWKIASKEVRAQIQNFFMEEQPLSEALLFAMLEKMVSENSFLFLGNGWPIRAADSFFFPNTPRMIFGNRGVSGIDGLIATASGCAAGRDEKLFAIIGDQSALHDLNSLALLKNTVLIIVNNRGGQIFSKLPIAKRTDLYDTFFAAKHTLDFAGAASMFGHKYCSATTTEELIEAIKTGKVSERPLLIEMFTEEKAQIETLSRLENHLNPPVKIECVISK